MSVYLINGDGNPKVTASQDADWYGAMTGEKTAILPMNDSFEYSILSNNLISIGSGVLVTREGRRVQIDNNDSIEIAIPSGAVGSNSYYIVGFRLYIDTDGTQKAEGFCQTMTSATETITETAFKEGSSTVYVSLYRITKVGVDIDSTDLLLPIFVGLDDKANQVSICSDIETVNSSASKSYSIGKYFWNTLTSKLRRVTSAISSGSTITDSNSTETTVADELSRINTDLSAIRTPRNGNYIGTICFTGGAYSCVIPIEFLDIENFDIACSKVNIIGVSSPTTGITTAVWEHASINVIHADMTSSRVGLPCICTLSFTPKSS